MREQGKVVSWDGSFGFVETAKLTKYYFNGMDFVTPPDSLAPGTLIEFDVPEASQDRRMYEQWLERLNNGYFRDAAVVKPPRIRSKTITGQKQRVYKISVLEV